MEVKLFRIWLAISSLILLLRANYSTFFPRIIKHRIEISASDQVQNRNGMVITDSACLRQKQRGQINISCVNKEKITYSRPFADNNHQDHSGSF